MRTPAAELMQSMRLCGVYRDTIRPVLYSTKWACDNVSKAFHLQEEMLARLRRHLGEQKAAGEQKADRLAGDEVVRTLLLKWLFAPLRVPTARLISAKGSKGVKVNESATEDDGGVLDLSDLRRQLEAIMRNAQARERETFLTDHLPGVTPSKNNEEMGDQDYLDEAPEADYSPSEDRNA
jgi:hypothetical protein